MASADSAVLRFGRTAAFGTDFAGASAVSTGPGATVGESGGVLTFSSVAKTGTFAAGDLLGVSGFTGANTYLNGTYISSGAGGASTVTVTTPAGLEGATVGSGTAGIVISKLIPMRVRSDTLAGGLEFTTDPEITGERSPSDAVLTGVSAGGDVAMSIPLRASYPWFQAALCNTWTHAGTGGSIVVALGTSSLAISNSGTTLTFGSGVTGLNTELAVGDFIRVSSSNAALRGVGRITAIDGTTGLTLNASNFTDISAVSTGSIVISKGDRVTEGNTRIPHDIERDYTDEAESGFPRFESMIVNTLQFSGDSGGEASMSVGFVGELETSPTPTATIGTACGRLVGETISAVSDALVFLDYGSPGCVQSYDMSLTNNVTPRRCVGQLGASNADLNAMDVTGSFSRYYTNRALYDSFLARTNVSLTFVFDRKDDQGALVVELPRCRLTEGARGVPGRNQQVFLNMSYQAQRDPTIGSAVRIWKWNY